MQHSEHFVTQVLEKVANRYVDETSPDDAPKWADLDMHQRQQIKQDLLATTLVILDAAKEVRGEIEVASSWPLQDHEVAEHLVAARESSDGRSEWTWLRTADGDLMLGLFPQGETYMALEGPAGDDFDVALTNDTVSWHRVAVED